jgi:hypothetical protein
VTSVPGSYSAEILTATLWLTSRTETVSRADNPLIVAGMVL